MWAGNGISFQFHLVRLKETRVLQDKLDAEVSIPFSTIKSLS